MSELEEKTNVIPPSKFVPTKEEQAQIDIESVIKLNNSFWEQQSTGMYKCYKQGTVYANNGNKKTSINLLQDLFKMLKQQFKDNSDNQQYYDNIFQQLNLCLQLIDDIGNSVDKNCLISIIQGYTIGCLSKYEK